MSNYEYLQAELKRWVEKYVIIDPIRVQPTAYVAKELFKNNERVQSQAIFCKATLWLFAVDDYFDDPDNSFYETLNYTSKLIGQLHQELEEVRILNEIFLVHKGQSLGDLENFFLYKTLNGMIVEKVSQKNIARFNSFEEYMLTAAYSIGTPFALFATLQSMDMYQKKYHSILLLAGRITRLLNDARSFEKELNGEGQENSISLIMRLRGVDFNSAKKKVEDIVSNDIRSLKKKCVNLNGVDRSVCQLAHSLCMITRDFYTHSDFHQYEEKKIQ